MIRPIRDSIIGLIGHFRLSFESQLETPLKVGTFKLSRQAYIQLLNFNLGWWAVAWAAAEGHVWLSLMVLPVSGLIHLWETPNRPAELTFYFVSAIFGFLVDSLLLHLNLFTLSTGSLWTPPWLVAMWVLLAFTMESFKAFENRPEWLWVIGGLTGPLTYIWCQSLNLLNYGEYFWPKLIVHGLIWAALTPFLLYSRRWLKGFFPPVPLPSTDVVWVRDWPEAKSAADFRLRRLEWVPNRRPSAPSHPDKSPTAPAEH